MPNRTPLRSLARLACVPAMICSIFLCAVPRAVALTPEGVITHYTDPSQAVSFGDRSYWSQPWRAYTDTVPATTLQSAIGVNFNVNASQADATAKLLADSGFRRARVEVGWDSLSYSDPTQLTTMAQQGLQAKITALRDNGIRPLILLNANATEPTPVEPGSIVLTQPAGAGARVLHVSSSSLAAVTVGRTGISSRGIAARTLFTGTDVASNTITLSQGLRQSLAAGTVPVVTLLYSPFAPPVTNGSPDRRFAETLQGWVSYVAVVTQDVKSLLGSDNFDVEVWNELTFGSNFLDLDHYYAPVPWSAPNSADPSIRAQMLQATISYIRNPANGLSDVGIGDGFMNQSPYGSGSNSPLGLTAIDKHPYAGLRSFPAAAKATGIRPIDGTGQLSGISGHDGHWRVWTDGFTPTYDSFFPEYFLTSTQTETLTHDLSPFATVFGGSAHGRYTHPLGGPPPQMWVTETNLDPTQGPVPASQLSAADISHIAAKDALRYFTSFVNKGVSALYMYAASAGGMSVIDPGFFTALKQNPTVYPGDAAGGAVTQAVGRLAAATAGATAISQPRSLALQNLVDYSGGIQFQGNGSPHFPDLYDRDVLAFLPFQDTNNSFTIAAYVMTRNVETNYEPGSTSPTRFDLPAETYQMTISGISGATATATATDPLTGSSVPVQIVGRGLTDVVVQMPVTDSPRLLSISDAGA
jgi:hypothetical protein